MRLRLPLIAICTAAVILTGCASQQDTTAQETAPAVVFSEEISSSEKEPVPTPKPEYSWSSEFNDLDREIGSLTPLCYTGEGFYAVSYEKTGEKIPDSVLSKAAENNTEVVNDGRFDVYKTRLSFVSLDGEVTRLKNYTSLPDAENKDGWDGFSSSSSLDGVAPGEDGLLYTLEHTTAAGTTEAETLEEADDNGLTYHFQCKWYIRTLDPKTGKIRSRKEIINEDGATFIGSGMHMRNGQLIISGYTGEAGCISVVNTDGTIERSIICDGSILRLIRLSDGRSAAEIYMDGTNYVMEADTEKYELVKIYELSEYVEGVYSGSGDYLFYYSDGIRLCGWKDGGEQMLFDWADVSANSGRVSSDFVMNSDGTAYFITNEYVEGDGLFNRLFKLTRTSYDEKNAKTVISLASENPDYCLKDTVAAFNMGSDDYCIRITDDFSNADILDLTGKNYQLMVASGELEDLYPYIDADAEINRSDLFSNVLVALEYDGKMCSSCAFFNIDTVLGPTAYVGDGPGWDYSRYYVALDAAGEECEPFDVYTTREDVFRPVLAMELDWFVDWENRECNFNNDRFEDLLRFVATFPESFDYYAREWTESDNTDLRIANGKQLLLRTTLYSFDDAIKAGFEFNQDISFIGYPSLNGTGNILNVMSLESGANFGISSKSANKDGAWQFIRVFFTPEYQSSKTYFPCNASLFKKQLNKAMECEYLLDEEGQPKMNEETGEFLIKPAGSMYLSNFAQVWYYPLSTVKAAKLVKLVNSTTKIPEYSDEVYRVVSSAAKPFFENKTDATAAANAVQDAMTAYLSRN